MACINWMCCGWWTDYWSRAPWGLGTVALLWMCSRASRWIIPVQHGRSPKPREPHFSPVFVPECHCQSFPFIPVLLVSSQHLLRFYSGLCHMCSSQLSELSGSVLRDFMIPHSFSKPPQKKNKTLWAPGRTVAAFGLIEISQSTRRSCVDLTPEIRNPSESEPVRGRERSK